MSRDPGRSWGSSRRAVPAFDRGVFVVFRNVPAASRLARISIEHDGVRGAGVRPAPGAMIVCVLQKTLDEERTADTRLTMLAESKVNLTAAS